MLKRIMTTIALVVIFGTLIVPTTAEGLSLMDFYDAYHQGLPFRAWPIEIQYKFAIELPTFIEKNNKDGNLFIPQSIKEIMENRYGLPHSNDLSQKDAQAKAIEYLSTKSDMSTEQLKDLTWTYSFVINEETNPKWIITVYDGVYIEKNRLYRLAIPAREGEIALLFDHSNAELSPDKMLEEFSRSLPQNRENWTYMDKASYGDKVRELMDIVPGFNTDQAYMIYGLPRTGELSYDDALAFAFDALNKNYSGEKGWDEKRFPLRTAEFVRVSHSKDEKETPYWGFVFGEEDFYQIFVYAGPSGPKVLVVYESNNSNG
ncbi:MAG: hypothetical protein GXZ13_01660 [Synergistaceae bacterium]|nr:hypothetical protein [Synergistaceae bacterium]